MARKYTNEFKVGIFVLICLAGLFYLTYRTGKFKIRKKGYNIFVVFNEVSGLEKNAPVMLNGLEVGKVEDMGVRYENGRTRILLRLWIKEGVKIGANPKVSIKTLGLMGEKYIQITAQEGNRFIHPGTRLYGKGPQDLDQLMEMAEVISKSAHQLLEEIDSLTKSLNSTLEENKDSIFNIIKNLELTSTNFKEFSEDIKRHPWKLLFKTKERKPRSKKVRAKAGTLNPVSVESFSSGWSSLDSSGTSKESGFSLVPKSRSLHSQEKEHLGGESK